MKSPVRRHASRAFTLVELLVVIGVIGLLLTLLSFGSGAVIESVRKTSTESTMRNVSLAIDAFSQTNPLRPLYDNPTRVSGPLKTFGSLPPYQVAINGGGGAINEVGTAVEMTNGNTVWFRPGGPTGTLAQRLTRDLSAGAVVGPAAGNPNFVALNPTVAPNRVDYNNDIRSLYAYLAAYEPAGVSQIPIDTLKPLPCVSPSPTFVDGQGRPTEAIRKPGTTGGIFDPTIANQDWINIYGIHDAWGVPLDYMLYVKVEPRYFLLPGGAPTSTVVWQVTDRQYALRSHGISRETYDERVRANGSIPWDDRKSIYSSPLPQPYAQVGPQGQFLGSAPNETGGGWTRAVGENEPPGSYGYVPAGP